jgi:hypothetical protein
MGCHVDSSFLRVPSGPVFRGFMDEIIILVARGEVEASVWNLIFLGHTSVPLWYWLLRFLLLVTLVCIVSFLAAIIVNSRAFLLWLIASCV